MKEAAKPQTPGFQHFDRALGLFGSEPGQEARQVIALSVIPECDEVEAVVLVVELTGGLDVDTDRRPTRKEVLGKPLNTSPIPPRPMRPTIS